MKRKDLLDELRKIAKERGEDFVMTEGGNHSKLVIGDKRTTVPRHNEIDNVLAKAIFKQIGGKPK
jgi:mRNA interferase HicA